MKDVQPSHLHMLQQHEARAKQAGVLLIQTAYKQLRRQFCQKLESNLSKTGLLLLMNTELLNNTFSGEAVMQKSGILPKKGGNRPRLA